MKTLEQLQAVKPYAILQETASHTVIKLWNRKKPETWHKQHISKERLIFMAEQDLSNAISQAQELQQRVNDLQIGDIVTYIKGYNCTLYQFAQVVKKTAKTVFLQLFEYQGMNQIAKPTNLTDNVIRVPAHLFGRYNSYNPNRVYENNED